MELGCGPYTQTLYMFEKARKDLWPAIKSVTLLDPNIFSYLQNVIGNTYKDGRLLGRKVILIGGPTEQFHMCEAYDTLTVINVVEHVLNSYQHFETSYFALKEGGQLVFNDRAWPSYSPVSTHDLHHQDWAYHPIRPKAVIFQHFLSFFEPTHCEYYYTDYKITEKYSLQSISYYLIGKKRPREEVWKELYSLGQQKKFPEFMCKQVTLEELSARKY